MISRSPISRLAKRAVPPCSLALPRTSACCYNFRQCFGLHPGHDPMDVCPETEGIDASLMGGRLHEKGGKRHDMPCHHNLEAYLDEYISAARLRDDPKSHLFRTVRRGSRRRSDITHSEPLGSPSTSRMADVVRSLSRWRRTSRRAPQRCMTGGTTRWRWMRWSEFCSEGRSTPIDCHKRGCHLVQNV